MADDYKVTWPQAARAGSYADALRYALHQLRTKPILDVVDVLERRIAEKDAVAERYRLQSPHRRTR